jgi:hypothetical protein
LDQLPSPVGESDDKRIRQLEEQLRIAEQKIYALTESEQKYHIKSTGKSYRFAMTSDWHIGSLYANVDALVEFYRYAYRHRRVRDFYCCGDLLEGDSMFRGQQYELREVGYQRQLDALAAVADQLPRNAHTHFVTGNHDASFAKQIGLNIGEQIESECRNMHCVGRDSGMVVIETPGGDLRIGLLHPDGGTAYALSYKAQKIIESWEGGSKPHILGIGHYHKAEWVPRYRNVGALQAGCFQNQTPFMSRKALAAHVGGWIVEVTLGELNNRIRTEFVAFF